MVLSNSLGTTSAMWEPQISLLRQRFRVIQYEHPGHGRSPVPPGPTTIESLADAVIARLDADGVERASFVGLSLGGMVGMNLAARYPDRLDRLVLACTTAYLPPPEAWAERAALVRRDGTGPLLEALLGRWFTPGFTEGRPDVADQVADMLAAADPEGYAGCCDAIGAMDQRPLLAGITAPTLVIAGADDPVTPPAAALELQQSIPGAALVVIAGAAHLANIERPEAFTTAVVGHLIGTATERGQATRRAVLGDEYVERSAARSTPFTQPFIELITRYAWGDIWTRPGLDRRTRSCITLAVLTALGQPDELALHVRAARRNGLTDDEIGEVLLHCAVYAGVPAANTAFAVAQRTLREMDE